MTRQFRARTVLAFAAASTLSTSLVWAQFQPTSENDRVTGLDVSAWQGNWTQAQWDTIHRATDQQVGGIYGDGRDFVFIRSSRGGTTGYYNQSDPNNNNNLNTLSQRYDDPYFAQNITRATNTGMLAGPYHFGRMDIISSTQNANGIPNNGTDEANHFIQMAGAWMRPGYLLPVFDFEAGSGFRTASQLAQFAIDFSNQIYAVKGIRPQVYIGNNYASPMDNIALSSTVASAYPNLWSARWPNQGNPNAIAIQNTDPGDYTSTVYGPWDNAPNPADPWDFWQYASTGHLNAYSGNLDLDVAHGNIEYVKDRLVPALWTQPTSGDWDQLSNWNSGEAPVAPVTGPGQVAPVGTLVLPTARLPGRPDAATGVTGENDTVNLIRDDADITVTFGASAPTTSIRNLNLNERLNIVGGSLTVSRNTMISTGGVLSVQSDPSLTLENVTLDAGGTLELPSGNTLDVAKLSLTGTTASNFTGGAATATIAAKAGAVNPVVDLTGGTRILSVGNSAASTDLRIALPLTNGNLTKDGDGTLELMADNSAFAGNINVNNGNLLVTAGNQLGSAGVTTAQASATVGGTVQISGNGLNIAAPVAIAGLGANGTGALMNISGNNTWAGTVSLLGAQGNLGQPGLNQIGAEAGTTLTISGVIQNAATWAKVGDGDVVLTASNSYSGLTRIFGGRIIVENPGALGTEGSSSGAVGNTFIRPGSSSALAFRAPNGSPGQTFNLKEWIFTEGTGVNGVQIDNLAGDNIFAGHLAFGGPLVSGKREAYVGVSAGSLEVQGGLYAYTYSGPEARNIIKSGPGTLILSGDDPQTPTNASASALSNATFNVNAGAVRLNGTSTNGANAPGVSTWNVNGAGSTLSLAKTGAAGGAAINLAGGTLHTDVAGVSVANAITVSENSAFDVASGASLTHNGGLTNASGKALQKNGVGTLTLAGIQSHAAGAAFSANAGTTNFNSDAGSPSTATLDVNVADAAIVNFNSTQHIDALSIASNATANLGAGGNTPLRATSLTVGATGLLDVIGNSVIVDYTGGSPIAYIEGLVRTGYHGGDWLGKGVSSSVVASNDNLVLAIADNADLAVPFGSAQGGGNFAGMDPDLTSVLLRVTSRVDLNLDGIISDDDAIIFSTNFSNGAPAWWSIGDLNYDGIFSDDDAILFSTYFEAGPGNDFAALPEPASVVVILAGLSMGIARRRRVS